jgi:hypothetical protein
MRNYLPRFASNAVAVFIASAILVGCSNGANVTPSQGGGLGSNSSWAAPSVAHGVSEPNIITDREKLISTTGSGSGGGCSVSIKVSGKARGPYHGKFTGNAEFAPCNPYQFSGAFVITSGSNTITGSFSGTGQSSCGRGGCVFGGKMTYTATLKPGGKKFAGKGQAAGKLFGSVASMDVYLQRFI